MFRKMRRGKQLLSMEDTVAVMNRCTNGVLACLGDEDYAYAVPLSIPAASGQQSCDIRPQFLSHPGTILPISGQ